MKPTLNIIIEPHDEAKKNRINEEKLLQTNNPYN